MLGQKASRNRIIGNIGQRSRVMKVRRGVDRLADGGAAEGVTFAEGS